MRERPIENLSEKVSLMFLTELNVRIFNMASTSEIRTRREKEQLGTEKKVWWQRGIQESVVKKP